MNETDKAHRRRESSRGTLVEQVLQDTLGEALTAIREECLQVMCERAATDERVLQARDHLIVVDQIESYLQRVVETGKLAKYQLEEAKS